MALALQAGPASEKARWSRSGAHFECEPVCAQREFVGPRAVQRDRELGLLLGDREREKVHAIDEALLRIKENEYGICEECEEEIPLGRLKAMPFARHCVKCKSDLEKLQAQTKRFEEERAYREIPLGAEEEEA